MLSKSFRIMTGLGVVAMAAGCPTRDISQLDIKPLVEVPQEIQVKTNRAVDILFVVDNSDSMREEQASLTQNFPKFINVLTTIQGGLPDVHIGVVSSDVGIGTFVQENCMPGGDHGALQNTPRLAGCPVPNSGARFISDVAAPGADGGVRITNYPGGQANLPSVFSCIAALGTTGCGFEQHLESMRQALDVNNTTNSGFLRDDAYLAVVILGDEDDCSAKDNTLFDPNPQLDTSVSLYGANTSYRCTEWGVVCDNVDPIPRSPADYLSCRPRAENDTPYIQHPDFYYNYLLNTVKKGNPNLLIGAVIAGNPTPFGVSLDKNGNPQLKPSCSSGNGTADPGVRLKYFADRFGDHGSFVSICQSDLSGALEGVARLLAKVIGTPCLDGKVDATDIDPVAPGLQVNCQVSDVIGKGTVNEQETVVPRCAMTNETTPSKAVLPCWWSSLDTNVCPSSVSRTHLALHVERATDSTDVVEVARCVSNGGEDIDVVDAGSVRDAPVTADARSADAGNGDGGM